MAPSPDLHAYDIERIEVLNGPQGTLFGAGSMSGAIRVITNKPDPNAFSAGVDVDGGKIQDGGVNSTYEGFVNLPIVDGKSAVRLSVYAKHDAGFIDNLLTTRQWVNGVVSTNAEWARNNYNTQNVDGGRAAFKQIFSDAWSAVLTGGYQSQRHVGAWDQDPTKYGERKVSRFGPESGNDYVKTLDLHIDGDVGIGDLVFASTYQQQTIHQVNEYAEYVQYSTVAGFLPEKFRPSLVLPIRPPRELPRDSAAVMCRLNTMCTTTIRSAGRTSCACNPNRAADCNGLEVSTGKRPRTPIRSFTPCRVFSPTVLRIKI